MEPEGPQGQCSRDKEAQQGPETESGPAFRLPRTRDPRPDHIQRGRAKGKRKGSLRVPLESEQGGGRAFRDENNAGEEAQGRREELPRGAHSVPSQAASAHEASQLSLGSSYHWWVIKLLILQGEDI